MWLTCGRPGMSAAEWPLRRSAYGSAVPVGGLTRPLAIAYPALMSRISAPIACLSLILGAPQSRKVLEASLKARVLHRLGISAN